MLGPNGAGKTTLLRILATLLRPSGGAVAVLGAELPRQAWKARGRIGYLGHQPLLYRELTVRENLEFNARLHRVERPARADRRAARAAPGSRAAATSWSATSPPGCCSGPRSAGRCCTSPSCCCSTSRARTSTPAAGEIVDALLGPRAGPDAGDRHPRARGRPRRGRPGARPARRRRRRPRRPGLGALAPATCARGLLRRGADERLPRDPRQGPADRAAHARVGAGDGAVRGHHLRPLSLRPRPHQRSRAASPPACCWRRCCSRRSWRSTASSSPSASRAASTRSASRPVDGAVAVRRQGLRARRLPGRAGADRGAGVRGPLRRRRGRAARRSRRCSLLADLGLATIGALVSSIAVNSRARDLIAPLLLLPLLVPVMIARRRRGRAAARRGRAVIRRLRPMDGGPRSLRSSVHRRRLRGLRLPARGLMTAGGTRRR